MKYLLLLFLLSTVICFFSLGSSDSLETVSEEFNESLIDYPHSTWLNASLSAPFIFDAQVIPVQKTQPKKQSKIPLPASKPSQNDPIPKLSVLSEKLTELRKNHLGKVSFALKNLTTGETLGYQITEVMPTASLIKVAIMIEAYAQAEEGKILLSELIELKKEELVGGSGILKNHFSPGAKLSLRDYIELMIVYSDNTATNVVLEKIGIGNTNQRMVKLGFQETKINAKVYKGSTTSVDSKRTEKYGLGSSSAREMLEIFEQIYQGKMISKKASQAMMSHLSSCDDRDKFSKLLPTSVRVYHKTGSVNDARNDGGILEFPGGPIILVVFTNQNKDRSWKPDNLGNQFCAQIAKIVFDFYYDPVKKHPVKK